MTKKSKRYLAVTLMVLAVVISLLLLYRVLFVLDGDSERAAGARYVTWVLQVIPLIMMIKGVQILRK